MDIECNGYIFSRRKRFRSIFTSIAVGVVLWIGSGPIAWADDSPLNIAQVPESALRKATASFGINTNVHQTLWFEFPDMVHIAVEDFPAQSVKFDIASANLRAATGNLTTDTEYKLPLYASDTDLSSLRKAQCGKEHGRMRALKRRRPFDRAALCVQRWLVESGQIASLAKKSIV